MSYAHDKHYGWIESAYYVKCSDLGKQVANILGYGGRCIYQVHAIYYCRQLKF